MSGAQLQTAGQLRNSFPFIVRKAVTTTVTLITAAPALLSTNRQNITEDLDIPFDYGPDKSGRVYMVINGISVILSAGTYAAAGIIAGKLYFQDTSGIKYHLISFGTPLPNAVVFNSDRIFGVYTPLFSPNPNLIGTLLWEDAASVISTLVSVVARLDFNIGYYGDYAEYDFNQLKKCEHHHYHGVDDKPEVDMTPV